MKASRCGGAPSDIGGFVGDAINRVSTLLGY